jgi:ATP-dependent 26S proteasome regulatory subunit
MRRLRFVMEFPIPSQEERKQIWKNVFPESVDITELDLHYLAKQFQLSGGHIRSIAFNACLRAAREHGNEQRKVSMADLLLSLKRELEKMERSADVESFGHYSKLLREAVA